MSAEAGDWNTLLQELTSWEDFQQEIWLPPAIGTASSTLTQGHIRIAAGHTDNALLHNVSRPAEFVQISLDGFFVHVRGAHQGSVFTMATAKSFPNLGREYREWLIAVFPSWIWQIQPTSQLTFAANASTHKSLYDPADPLALEQQVEATKSTHAGFSLQFSQCLAPWIFVDLKARADKIDYRVWEYDHETGTFSIGLRILPSEMLTVTLLADYGRSTFKQESSRGPFGLPIPNTRLETERWGGLAEIHFFRARRTTGISLESSLSVHHLAQRDRLGAWHSFNRTALDLFVEAKLQSWRVTVDAGYAVQDYLHRRFSLLSQDMQKQNNRYLDIELGRRFGDWEVHVGFNLRRFASNNARISYLAREYIAGIEYSF